MDLQALTDAIPARLVAIDAACLDGNGDTLVGTFQNSALAAIILIPLQALLIILVTFQKEIARKFKFQEKLDDFTAMCGFETKKNSPIIQESRLSRLCRSLRYLAAARGRI